MYLDPNPSCRCFRTARPPGRGRSPPGAPPLFRRPILLIRLPSSSSHSRSGLPYVIARLPPLPRPQACRRLAPSTPDLHRMEADGYRLVPCRHGGGQGQPHASTLRCHGGSKIWRVTVVGRICPSPPRRSALAPSTPRVRDPLCALCRPIGTHRHRRVVLLAHRPRAFYSGIGIDFIDTISEYYAHLISPWDPMQYIQYSTNLFSFSQVRLILSINKPPL